MILFENFHKHFYIKPNMNTMSYGSGPVQFVIHLFFISTKSECLEFCVPVLQF